MAEGVRLNKYISDTGICSRREADRLIEEGRVRVNGRAAGLGLRVGPDDDVTVNGRAVRKRAALVYLLLNKPRGVICVTDRAVQGNITDFVGHAQRIFPVGRLDKDSEGLIILTNDGDIVNKILRAGNRHEKEYLVHVHRPVTDDFVKRMAAGLPILGTVTRPCKVERTGPAAIRITLTQGLNRQIRRMCEFLGYEVLRLERVRIMHLTAAGLRLGQWRDLTAPELVALNTAVAGSVGTEEAFEEE